MRKKAILIAALLTASTAVAAPSNQRLTGFLKLPDIKGDSDDDVYRDWHVVAGYQMQVQRPLRAAGLAPARSKFRPLEVRIVGSAAMPDLAVRCANGKHLGSVELHMVDFIGEERVVVQKLTLADVVILSLTADAERIDE